MAEIVQLVARELTARVRWEETEIQTIYVAFLLALQASDKPPKRHLVDSES